MLLYSRLNKFLRLACCWKLFSELFISDSHENIYNIKLCRDNSNQYGLVLWYLILKLNYIKINIKKSPISSHIVFWYDIVIMILFRSNQSHFWIKMNTAKLRKLQHKLFIFSTQNTQLLSSDNIIIFGKK